MARKKRLALNSSRESAVIERMLRLKIEVPSWGYADTGTRFGKYLQDAAAVDLADKLSDAGITHACTGMTPTVAVHMQWDFPDGFDKSVVKLASKYGVKIGAINPNLFQDQCYQHGSITNRDPAIRRHAVQHIKDSIAVGRQTGSRYLSLWFADGTNYPGQGDVRQRKAWATAALKEAYRVMPSNMTMLLEYKPYEPATYFTDFFDWGASYIFAKAVGPRAKVLVDLGHHLPGCNIEQIVAWLIDEKMLGGFHFNDRKYSDDDLTTGSIDPYQAFRIFNEIASYEAQSGKDLELAYMIDQSHHIKSKIGAMIQTVSIVSSLFAKALLVDRKALAMAQKREDTIASEELLRGAFFADVEPILRQVRKALGAPADPLAAFASSGYEQAVAAKRRAKRKALKLDGGSNFA
ncbi:MAG: TIM barrel protein [Phycisphaerae bacterium]|jgi:L-rhamnose isomerase/sugar isomerase